MRVTYPSKVDLWLQLVIVALIIVSSVSLITVLRVSEGPAFLWALLPAVVGIGFPLWILSGTNYTLDGDLLFVASGPFRWRIPVKEISSIVPTRNPLSSPALSIDRLRIEYGNGRVIMISPEDKDAFMAHVGQLR